MTEIALSDVLAELRSELTRAQAAGDGENIRFIIDDAEITLQVATTKEGIGKTGVKFWVVNAEAGGKLAEAVTQTLRLKLKVTGPGGGDASTGATLIADRVNDRPK